METWKRIVLWGISIGVGFALAASLVIGGAVWWPKRPAKPVTWSDSAITAKLTTITVQNDKDVLHIFFQYALTNHTDSTYSLPMDGGGSLMRRIPEDKSMDKFEGATWDSVLAIPANQTFIEKFNIVYNLSDYGTSTSELEKYEPGENRKEDATQALAKFMNRRLSEIDGLVFYDYENHYRIELPRTWDLKKPK